MLISVIIDYCGTGIWLIAQNPPSGCRFKLFYNFLRKAVRVSRERFFRNDSRYLPVTYCGILALTHLLHPAIGANRKLNLVGIINSIDIEESESLHIRSVILTAAIYRLQCVGTFIAEFICIRRMSHTKAVKHNNKNSSCHIHLFPRRIRRFTPPQSNSQYPSILQKYKRNIEYNNYNTKSDFLQ